MLLQQVSDSIDKLLQIHKVDTVDAERISASPDEPHVHDYEELIIGVEGCLDHFIDHQSRTIRAPFISFVTKGKLHRAIPRTYEGKCDFWVIRFKSEFIAETTFQLYSYYHNYANIEIKPGTCLSRLTTLCELIGIETQPEIPNYAIIKQLLSTLCTMIEAERQKTVVTENAQTKHLTFKNFLSLLEENFKTHEGVEFYANKLFMSSRNLNLICHSILEQSISDLIQTRRLTEAKNLLITTDKTVAEIGYEIGYNEKSYFSNIFKKKTGQTPSEFREEIKKQLIS